MTVDVKTCNRENTLHVAAEIMWENDCGCVPVVDEHLRPVGILTDRDICMTAYVDGRGLREIPVTVPLRDDPVSSEVWSCRPDDTLDSAADVMRKYKVRHLPVVGSDGRLVGILSLTDLAREAAREREGTGSAGIDHRAVGEILSAIREPDSVGD